MVEASAAPRLRLDLRQPNRHLVLAQLDFTPAHTQLDLRLPAWTPGSYLIRDYVRTLEDLRLMQGERPVPLRRLGPAHWRALLNDRAPVCLSYRLLAVESSVRTSQLQSDHGFVVLAQVALQIDGQRWNPHALELRLPPDWQAFVPLPEDGEGGWLARDYDQLVDSPVEVGALAARPFAVAGVPHRWVSWGQDPTIDAPSWLLEVAAVCQACCQLMGTATPPAQAYLLVLHLLEQGYGGLEHDNSCVLVYGRRALATPQGRRKLLQLVAHEYLHQWNGRRLRPAPLWPIDYDGPVIVSTLWFVEGITSYYDLFLPHLAGLSDEADVITDLGDDLCRYFRTPGRFVQSLRESSEEAWVKLYRQDAYSSDNQISYYIKGTVLALILDLHLRRHGAALSSVLRQLWASHGRWGRGYGEADLLAAFTDHAADLSTLLPIWLESRQDPPVDSYLEDVGLSLIAISSSHPCPGWQLERPGCCGLKIKQVMRDGPAEVAGLQVGDELLAIERSRVMLENDLTTLLNQRAREGEPLEILFCRFGQVQQTCLRPSAPEVVRYQLNSNPGASPAMLQRRRQWLALVP
ncbi:MAG: M61 family peptidase [Cyanobacteria bacterium]|nr:M61 family peptidase [Cyanobacteriota bacterium]